MTSLAVVLTGWYAGYIITAIIIAAVVILVASILALARRIGEQAAEINRVLDDARANTMVLWNLEKLNDALRSIVGSATAARGVLGG